MSPSSKQMSLTRNLQSRLEIARADELRKLRRTRDIRALADHQEAFVGGVVVSLRAGKP